MNYKFKKIKLSIGDKIWLEELYVNIYCKIDISVIKVKLWDKLPEKFDPKNIDIRLVNNFGLSLIGLWHIDPNNKLFNISEKILNTMKRLIHNNSSINRLKSIEIVEIINESQEDVEIALKLIYGLHSFFGSASSNSENFGFTEVCFRNDEFKFDNILRFKTIEKSMEEYFLKTKIANERFIQTLYKKTDKNVDKDIWTKIENEYGISKRSFGKKIYFVKDTFKRKIIFRDVSHAFELAYNGFSKPSVILSGSVIEELLRLYLISNNIELKTKTFNEYIKSCEDNGLIKIGISRLSDSVRHFRNLVHIAREDNKKYSISKSTAKGAIASIFTIINNF